MKNKAKSVKVSDYTSNANSMNLFLSGAPFMPAKHQTKRQKELSKKHKDGKGEVKWAIT